MRGDSGGLARQVPCPECGAAPGQPCRSTSTRAEFHTLVHRDRAQAAKETSD